MLHPQRVPQAAFAFHQISSKSAVPGAKAAVAVDGFIMQHLAMIHVLFSSAAGTLRQLLSDRGEEDDVALFADTLDWGPIQTGSFVEREEWFDRFAPTGLGKCDWLDEGVKKFRQKMAENPERVIWISPRCQQDLSGLHWFLAEFGGEGSKMIVADYPLDGTWLDEPPLRLSELQVDQVAQLLDGCERRIWDSSKYPKDRWRTLMAENAHLRVVENGRLCSVETDYFDHFLLARCPADWMASQRLIADVMGDIWTAGHSPDPDFLYWRLRELIQNNAIISNGDLPLLIDLQDAPKVRLRR